MERVSISNELEIPNVDRRTRNHVTILIAVILSLVQLCLAPPVLAADGFLEGPRGTLGVFAGGSSKRIVEWIGPGSATMPLPPLESNQDALLRLQVVPNGMALVRQASRQIHIAALALYAVKLTDEDLDFIATSCPNLESLLLIRWTAMPRDQFGDLTNDERTALESAPLSQKGFQAIGKLTNLMVLQVDGYDLPADRLRFLSGLKQLQGLILRNTDITDSDLEHLESLSKLKQLDLAGTSVTGAGLRHLRNCRALDCINLDRTKAGDNLATYLNGQAWPKLASLYVQGCQITAAGLDKLNDALPFTAVISISEGVDSLIPGTANSNPQTIRKYRAALSLLCGLTKPDLEVRAKQLVGLTISLEKGLNADWVVAHSALLDGLKHLSLANCEISDAGFMFLGPMDQLEILSLKGTPLDDTRMQYVANLRRLKRIDITGTNVTDAAAQQLSKLTNLEYIIVDETRITDAGLKVIAKLPALKTLSLVNCRITDEGLDGLGEAKNLEGIRLDGTLVSDKGIPAIVRLPMLRGVSLNGCDITDKGADQLLTSKTLKGYNLRNTHVSEGKQ